MARTSKLFGENAYKRSSRDVKEERDLGYGRLNDYWKDYTVHMHWTNDKGQLEDDQLFVMKITGRGKDVKVLISKEELLRFLRWV